MPLYYQCEVNYDANGISYLSVIPYEVDDSTASKNGLVRADLMFIYVSSCLSKKVMNCFLKNLKNKNFGYSYRCKVGFASEWVELNQYVPGDGRFSHRQRNVMPGTKEKHMEEYPAIKTDMRQIAGVNYA